MGESDQRSDVDQFLKMYLPRSDGHLPKHAALRDALGKAISEGFWKPGAKLPTEIELADASPFGLGTVQRALRTLMEQGLVERRRRHGTFVPERRSELESPWHCRFLNDDGKTFLPVYTKALNRITTERHGPWTGPLEQTDQTVIQIDRRFEVNSEFAVYTRFFILHERCPRLLEVPLEELSGVNLKILIMQTMGTPITAINEQIRQAVLPRAVCQDIDVAEDTVGLHMQATTYASAMPVYYQELFIPPTERRLYIDSRLPTAGW